MYAYEQALLTWGHHPDIWYEAALFLERSANLVHEKGDTQVGFIGVNVLNANKLDYTLSMFCYLFVPISPSLCHANRFCLARLFPTLPTAVEQIV